MRHRCTSPRCPLPSFVKPQGSDGRRISASSVVRVLVARHTPCVLELLGPPRPGDVPGWPAHFVRVLAHATLGASLTCLCPEGVLAPRSPGAARRRNQAAMRGAYRCPRSLACAPKGYVLSPHGTLGASLICLCPEGVLDPRSPGAARRRIDLGRMHPSGAATSERSMHAARAKTAGDARLAACTGRG